MQDNHAHPKNITYAQDEPTLTNCDFHMAVTLFYMN